MSACPRGCAAGQAVTKRLSLRRGVVSNFPYPIVYVEPAAIHIIAIEHTKRFPGNSGVAGP